MSRVSRLVVLPGLCFLLSLLGASIGSWGIQRASAASSVLTTTELRLVDQAGNVRGLMGVQQNGVAHLTLFGGAGQVAMTAPANLPGSFLVLNAGNQVTWAAPGAPQVAAPGVAPPTSVTAPPPTGPGVIESKIDGDFEGWEGETVFKLANGQIWQQSSYAYHYHYAYRPDVLIYPSGSVYKMKVEGVDKAITVVRIK